MKFHRKTTDIPEYYREEGELIVPSYGYFIRGAQTTFSGVLRLVNNLEIKIYWHIKWETEETINFVNL